MIAYLGLGSNLGDRVRHLQAAVNYIDLRVGSVLRISRVYETAPLYRMDQPWFLNVVLEVKTRLAPLDLLRLLKLIEKEMGRSSSERYTPRVIDIDILAVCEEQGKGMVSLKSDELVLPHLGLTERRFVLEPLIELAPDLVVNGIPVKEWLGRKEIQEQEVRCMENVLLSVHSD
ncbi:MAG: 2-amino-4-hydroxy-6-hydroxymethyldihydropteridine diphosphokinase [Candidatus Caldarchaeum sp.]